MTKAERAHKDAVAALGCVACMKLHGCTTYSVELHHLRTGGWGKGSYLTLMPLCYTHHHSPQFGIHGMGSKAFDRYYGDVERFGDRAFTQRSLLEYTLEKVNA